MTGARLCFHRTYRSLLQQVATPRKPLAACTIYDAVPGLTEELRTALSIFNDIITREALFVGAQIIDLRQICTTDDDYSTVSPIEPSERGGLKIAQAISSWVGSLKES